MAVLKGLTSQTMISLENSRLYRELQEREAQIRRLHGVLHHKGTGAGAPLAAPTAPPAQHPSRAGPAAAVWRPALAAPGGRHWALVSWGRPRAVTRGRQGGWAPAVAKAVPEQPQPRWLPGRRPGRGLLAPARAGPPRGWAPPGPPWPGLRQAGSVGRAGRPQAWAPAGAGGQGVGGRGRGGRREKWLIFLYPRTRQRAR